MKLTNFGYGMLSQMLGLMRTSSSRLWQISVLVVTLAVGGLLLPQALGAAAPLPPPVDPNVNPITGQVYQGLRHADLVESLIFLKEFKIAHPDETAVLLLPQITVMKQSIYSAVAFTLRGTVGFYSCRFGARKAVGITAEALVSPAGTGWIYDSFVRQLGGYYRAKLGEKGDAALAPLTMLWNDVVPNVVPESRPGDSDDVQVTRAFLRLQQLGIGSSVTPLKDKNGQRLLMLACEWDGLIYRWVPSDCCGYDCLAEQRTLNSVLLALFTVVDYKKSHPSETVKLLIHDRPNAAFAHQLLGKALYTRDGQMRVWYRLGEQPSTLTVADLADEEKIIRVESAHFAILRHNDIAPRSLTPDHKVDYPPVDTSAAAMLVEMQKRGITASLAKGANSWDPVLRFEWAGKSYVYTDALGCFPAATPLPQ